MREPVIHSEDAGYRYVAVTFDMLQKENHTHAQGAFTHADRFCRHAIYMNEPIDCLDVLTWPRAPRSSVTLGTQHGLYALFIAPHAELPGMTPGTCGLIYIGRAMAAKGLKGRCHFRGRTGNHSPRKSLAVLLKDILSLKPVAIVKRRSSPSWKLDKQGESRLSQWMMENLLLATFCMDEPADTEKFLIRKYAPALNLDGCTQTDHHRAISRGRSLMRAQAMDHKQSP